MPTTVQLLGERLKSLRLHLQLRQEDIAKNLQINQNVISRIENGSNNGRIENLLLLINYYGKFCLVDNILSETFVVIELNSISEQNKYESIAAEKLKLTRDIIHQELSNLIHLLER